MMLRLFLVFLILFIIGIGPSSSKSIIMPVVLSVIGCGIAFLLAKRYYNGYQTGRIRLPLDDFSSSHMSLTSFWITVKDSTANAFYWIYDKLVSLKDEISYRLNPTPYRYTPVSSIPRPSFEYEDFDD